MTTELGEFVWWKDLLNNYIAGCVSPVLSIGISALTILHRLWQFSRYSRRIHIRITIPCQLTSSIISDKRCKQLYQCQRCSVPGQIRVEAHWMVAVELFSMMIDFEKNLFHKLKRQIFIRNRQMSTFVILYLVFLVSPGSSQNDFRNRSNNKISRSSISNN